MLAAAMAWRLQSKGMATTRRREDARHDRGPTPLGNGREDSLSDEELGRLSRSKGPESQGAYAGEDFGIVEQGAYGDEDFDASYQRDGEVTSVDPDADVVPPEGERDGPGRGVRGGEWVREEPLEPPDELTRKVLDLDAEEKRRDDLAVQDDVVDVLSAALPGIRELRVSVQRGEVTLDGEVEDRATEIEAYRLAARIPGVVDVAGRLRVAHA
jgi:hypothetical protein